MLSKGTLPTIEHKAAVGVQEVNDRMVTGFPAILGNVDDGGDVTLVGAFGKTLKERGPRLRWLWMHDAKAAPIARIVEISEVGPNEVPTEIKTRHPDVNGALMVRREYLETPRAEEVLTGIKAGAINEMSFAYDALQTGTPDEALRWGKGAKRLLKEVRLWEMSDVNWGMNPATANIKGFVLPLFPEEPGPARSKAVAEWLEAQLHLRLTELADDMYGNGHLTREERIALSGVLGNALNVFHEGLMQPGMEGVRERERYEKPEKTDEDDKPAGVLTPSEMSGAAERIDAKLNDEAARAMLLEAARLANLERKRRVQLAMARLHLAGA